MARKYNGSGQTAPLALRMTVAVVLMSVGLVTCVAGFTSPARAATSETWSVAKGSPRNAESGLMACADAGTQVDCVNGDSAYSTDGGASWHSPGTAASLVPANSALQVTQQLNQTTCVSAAGSVDCVAVGDIHDNIGDAYPIALYSNDGGQHWGGTTLSLSGGPLRQVACVWTGSRVDCVSGPFYSTDGGADWSYSTGIIGGSPTCVSLVSAVDCISIGTNSNGQSDSFSAAFSSDGGASWTPSTVPNVSYPGSGAQPFLSCAAATSGVDCSAIFVGPLGQSSGLYSTNGGANWSVATGITQAYVSCWTGPNQTSVHCASVAYNGATSHSSDGGANWTSGTPIAVAPDQGIGINDYNGGTNTLACESNGFCEVVGGSSSYPLVLRPSIAAVSTDGGATWASATYPSGVALMYGLTCSTSATCAVFGEASGGWGGVLTTSPVPQLGASFFGSMGGQHVNQPIVGIARTLDGDGYWEVASDGGIFSFGNATFWGSMGGHHLNEPIVGIAATPSGGGYWEVASDGGVFNFGDSAFYGSMGGEHLNKPIVGIAATPSGGGYWEVASDGGVFSFGDATFYGSTGGIHLNKPIVGMAADPLTGGYWLAASDGGVFSFNAGFFGSAGSIALNKPIVGIAPEPDGGGYRLVASDGGVFAFGSASFNGSMGGRVLNSPIVGIASTPDGGGYWEVASDGGLFAF